MNQKNTTISYTKNGNIIDLVLVNSIQLGGNDLLEYLPSLTRDNEYVIATEKHLEEKHLFEELLEEKFDLSTYPRAFIDDGNVDVIQVNSMFQEDTVDKLKLVDERIKNMDEKALDSFLTATALLAYTAAQGHSNNMENNEEYSSRYNSQAAQAADKLDDLFTDEQDRITLIVEYNKSELFKALEDRGWVNLI